MRVLLTEKEYNDLVQSRNALQELQQYMKNITTEELLETIGKRAWNNFLDSYDGNPPQGMIYDLGIEKEISIPVSVEKTIKVSLKVK